MIARKGAASTSELIFRTRHLLPLPPNFVDNGEN